MLKLVHSIEAVRDRTTLTYRGYVLELTRAGAGWQVGVHPQKSDLPILSRTDFMARDKDSAIDQANKRVDWRCFAKGGPRARLRILIDHAARN